MVALRQGVLYVPWQFCYVNGDNGPVPMNEARLSFGVAPVGHLREAVGRLARAAGTAVEAGANPSRLSVI